MHFCDICPLAGSRERDGRAPKPEAIGTRNQYFPILKTSSPRNCYFCSSICIMIKTGNPVISIYTEMTPNPETMKFVANKLLYPGKSIDFPDVEGAKPSPLAIELFGFPFIKSVFIASNFVTLTKIPDTDWADVIPTIRQFLKEYLEEGKPVINEEDVVIVRSEGNTDRRGRR